MTKWLPNLGGPGWIEDVFTLKTHFDTPYETPIKSYFTRECIPVFTSTNEISGVLTVTAPPKRTVGHLGITVTLTSTIHHLSAMDSYDIYTKDIAISVEDSVTGSIDYPFSLNIEEFSESFEGECVTIRHAVVFKVSRPWYTFDVWSDYICFAIQRLEENNSPVFSMEPVKFNYEPILREVEREEARMEDSSEDMRKRPLDIEQFSQDGPHLPVPEVAAVLDYGMTSFEASETVETSVVLLGKTKAELSDFLISKVKIVLLRLESINEEEHEYVVNEWITHDSTASNDEESKHISGVQVLSQKLDFNELCVFRPFTVQYGDNGEEEDGRHTISVRYMLRLHCTEAGGNEYWNSHDVTFHRVQPSSVEEIARSEHETISLNV